jgi:hypothetical protein
LPGTNSPTFEGNPKITAVKSFEGLALELVWGFRAKPVVTYPMEQFYKYICLLDFIAKATLYN